MIHVTSFSGLPAFFWISHQPSSTPTLDLGRGGWVGRIGWWNRETENLRPWHMRRKVGALPSPVGCVRSRPAGGSTRPLWWRRPENWGLRCWRASCCGCEGAWRRERQPSFGLKLVERQGRGISAHACCTFRGPWRWGPGQSSYVICLLPYKYCIAGGDGMRWSGKQRISVSPFTVWLWTSYWTCLSLAFLIY